MEESVLTINNQGVQILLNRMQSNPEEFLRGATLSPARWDWLLEQVVHRVEHHHKSDDNYRVKLPFLTNEEVDALYDKWMSIQGDAFTHRIMRELLEDEADSGMPNIVRYSTQDGLKPQHILEIAKKWAR
jgi:hypothetical protein